MSQSTNHSREIALAKVIYNLWEATNCNLYNNMDLNPSIKVACLFKRRYLKAAKLPKALTRDDWHSAGRENQFKLLILTTRLKCPMGLVETLANTKM